MHNKLYKGMTMVLFLSVLVSGCSNTVRVDGNPSGPGLFSDGFSLSDSECRRATGGTAELPIDQYHAGQCYEKGVGVAVSMEKAVRHYIMAARWGVPEAQEALRRFGKAVPEADLQQRQQGVEQLLQQKRRDESLQKIERERTDAIRDLRWQGYDHLRYHHYKPCRNRWCW